MSSNGTYLVMYFKRTKVFWFRGTEVAFKHVAFVTGNDCKVLQGIDAQSKWRNWSNQLFKQTHASPQQSVSMNFLCNQQREKWRLKVAVQGKAAQVNLEVFVKKFNFALFSCAVTSNLHFFTSRPAREICCDTLFRWRKVAYRVLALCNQSGPQTFKSAVVILSR